MKALDWLFRRMTEDLTKPRALITREAEEGLAKMASGTDRLHELSERFTYHAPTPDQIGKYGAIRTRAKEFAFLLDEKCPASPELEHALHHLDMVVMNANAAIARHTS